MRLSLVSAALGLIAACSLPALAQTTGHAGAGSHAVDSQTKVDAIAGAVFDNLVEVTDMHFHKGEYNHIVNLSRMIVGARPQNVEVYADAAWLLWSMNRDAEAVALNQQGAEANPHTYFMFDELGQYYTRKRDWPHAVEYYEKAAACSDCPDMTVHGLAHASITRIVLIVIELQEPSLFQHLLRPEF